MRGVISCSRFLFSLTTPFHSAFLNNIHNFFCYPAERLPWKNACCKPFPKLECNKFSNNSTMQMHSAVCSFPIFISCFSMQTDLPYCLVWAVPNWILILFLCMTAIPARFCKTMQKPFATAMQNYRRMKNTLCSCNRQQNRRSLISVPWQKRQCHRNSSPSIPFPVMLSNTARWNYGSCKAAHRKAFSCSPCPQTGTRPFY